MEEIKIYWDDLKKEKQIEIQEKIGFVDPKKYNWDIIPLTSVYLQHIDDKA